MIATLAALATMSIGGVAIARALDPSSRGAALLARGFLLGLGTASLILLLFTNLGIAWSLSRAGIGFVAVAVLAALAARRRRRPVRAAAAGPPASRSALVLSIVLWIVVAATLAGHAIFATLASPPEWDYWAIWGLKGKVFAQAGAVDWSWLERPANAFAHPDYPPLLPLAYDTLSLAQGGWDDRWFGLLFTALAATLVALVAAEIRSEASPVWAAVAAAALAGPVAALPIGLAELPLLAFATAGLLDLRGALLRGEEERMPMAGVLLGLAAMTKNEGSAILVAAVLAGVLAARPGPFRPLLRLWPAPALAGWWLLLRSAHGLSTDLFAGDLAGRIFGFAGNLAPMFGALMRTLPLSPLFWAAALLILLLGRREALARERFLLAVMALQIAFYLGTYTLTPRDAGWHVRSSWRRVVTHVAAPLVFVAVIVAMDAQGRGREREGRVDGDGES
ncbi:MAG TPA: hypothetical protein VM557_08140 [Thermoanaerobaculia bacterium]|nr:hypothetical protein [Thermoanaerobaculia bacterium]